MSEPPGDEAILARLPEQVRALILARAVPIAAPAGAVLFRPGDLAAYYLLLLRGTVRVQLVTADGHTILLYRVRPGESCTLTMSSLLGQEAYAAEGLAETEVRGLGLPTALFERLIAESHAFRQLVFAAFGRRLADLMLLLDEVAFRPMDARLAGWLLEQAGSGGFLPVTHQAIAAELGTAREVVSRRLKELARQGLVRLARGQIELADQVGLRRLAALSDRTGSR